jgi:hypothetical protein
MVDLSRVVLMVLLNATGQTRPLAEIVAELRARHDLLSSDELTQRRSDRLTTEIPELDALLGGGFPMGVVVELARGKLSAGTAVALRLIERLTSLGHLVALCDGANAFDGETAARAGVDLDRLFLAQPATLHDALRATYALVTSGGFPLVVLDLGSLADRERPPVGSTWMRLARSAELSHVGLLILGSERCSPGSFAGICLSPEGVRPQFSGRGRHRVFKGVELTLSLTRNKLGIPPGRARLMLEAPLLEPPVRAR